MENSDQMDVDQTPAVQSMYECIQLHQSAPPSVSEQLQQNHLFVPGLEHPPAESPNTHYHRMLRYYLQYHNGSAGEAAATGLMTPDSNSSIASDDSDCSTDLDSPIEWDESTEPAEHHFKYLNILKEAADRLKARNEAEARERQARYGMETPVDD